MGGVDIMTQKKQLRDQMAVQSYRQQAMESTLRPIGRREHLNEAQIRDNRETARTGRRVVSVPQADPSTAWNTFAQRQEKIRRARSKPQTYIETAPRTYAQTGRYATTGRIRAIPRQQQYNSSPVPKRSGRSVVRRSFIWRLLSLIAMIFVLALGANFAFTSNAFRIEQVNVVGTHNNTLIANIQNMGMQGQNIFLINVVALTDRIEANPLVASVSLDKQWPNQLTVSIVERTPALLWQTGQGIYIFDRQAVVIASPRDLPAMYHLL